MIWSDFAMVDLDKVGHAFDDLIQKMFTPIIKQLNRVITFSYEKIIMALTSSTLITLVFTHEVFSGHNDVFHVWK